MGLFSWITQDTNRSIPHVGASRKHFTVYMLDNKGRVWKETSYAGYGVFGNKDYYELLAEMNGMGSDRLKGIDLEGGIHAIENKKTGKVYKADIDFSDWNDILCDGKSANQLCETDDWKSISIKREGIIYPNLVEDIYKTWVPEGPKTCPDQGHFYDTDDDGNPVEDMDARRDCG